MTGADAVLATLADNGVEACFANPGTSEMPFVSALDREPRVRPVLCLFEGVATGAADGYARMALKPAATLLHLGPGYANGIANLHNARRAFSPVVNIIGEHALRHRQYEAPLTSDIQALAKPGARWLAMAASPDEAAALAAEAVVQSLGPPGGLANLILPADCAWSPASGRGPVPPKPVRRLVESARITAAARALAAARRPVLLLGGQACLAQGVAAAGRIASGGVRVITDTFSPRLARGAGLWAFERLPYFAEQALGALEGCDLMLIVGTQAPVAFFAYPDLPSLLVPDGCEAQVLADPGEDAIQALTDLAEAMGRPAKAAPPAAPAPSPASGPLNAYGVGAALARHLPAGAVVSDDAVTSSLPVISQTRGAAPHDWLALTGGAIGQGLPAAVGAAVACPGRKVVALTGDGAAMYTLQALWTLARERLDVTVVVFANHAYRILNVELARTGAGAPGPAAASLLSLGDPPLDWVSLAQGMGVPAERCATAETFDAACAAAMAQPGPRLIEAVLG